MCSKLLHHQRNQLLVIIKIKYNNVYLLIMVFFFFKQMTAYEISECDWSSDVCSSDFFFFKQKTAYEIFECDWRSDVCSSDRSEAHTSEPQYQSEVLYAAFCLGLEYRRD